MEPKQILTASFLDIVFDDRNKQYGAYDLRATYPQRIKRALLFTFAIALLAFTAAALGSREKRETAMININPVELTEVTQEVETPVEPPPPVQEPEPQVQTQQYTEYNIVPEDTPVDPVATQDDLDNSRIDLDTREGVPDEGLTIAKPDDGGLKIIEDKKETEPDIFVGVEVEAKFLGNWEKFLIKNLNPNTPVDHNAPSGIYRVVVQFVVDVDGTVSDVKALTNFGYGMEQEAIRVLKKAEKWEPAFQNGRHVKAYRKQPITFQVVDGE